MGIYEKQRIIDRRVNVGVIEAWFTVEASDVEVRFSSGDGANSKGSFRMSEQDAIAAARAILKHFGECE